MPKNTHMTAEEAEAARAALAAYDRAKREEANSEALAPLQPLVGVLDGEAFGAILSALEAARPAITDRRLTVHLDGLFQTGTTARRLFGEIVQQLQAPVADAPSTPST